MKLFKLIVILHIVISCNIIASVFTKYYIDSKKSSVSFVAFKKNTLGSTLVQSRINSNLDDDTLYDDSQDDDSIDSVLKILLSVLSVISLFFVFKPGVIKRIRFDIQKRIPCFSAPMAFLQVFRF
jgi:hypothetical protein